jgi:hypothetical protein
MNDLTLIMAALFGLALTAGAIVRDTRHRLAVLHIPTADLLTR